MQVVVITGASSGLGESLAHAFYKAGCKVVLAARRMDELQRVRSELLESHVVRYIIYIAKTGVGLFKRSHMHQQ